MKKRSVLILGMLAVALALVLAGCPDGGSSGSSDPAYSGKFGSGSDEVLFELDNIGSSSSSLSIVGGRSLAVTGSTSITGRLKDPSGVHRVSGTYDTASGAFEVSADDGRTNTGSRYRISGTFDSNKQVLAANALVYDKSKTDDTSLAVFDVTKGSGAIGGGGVAMTGDLPNEFVGTWSFRDNMFPQNTDWENGWDMMRLIFSPYTVSCVQTAEGNKAGSGKVTWINEMYGCLLVQIDQVPDADTATYPTGCYDAIFAIPGIPTAPDSLDRDAVNTEFRRYLTSKRIDADRKDSDDVPWDEWATNGDDKEYYINSDGSVHCHNFTVDNEWLTLLKRLRAADHRSLYVKLRLWIDGSGRLHVGFPAEEFDNLTGAQNADSLGDIVDGFTRQ